MTLDLILRAILTLGLVVLTLTMLVYGEFNPVEKGITKRQLKKLRQQYSSSCK